MSASSPLTARPVSPDIWKTLHDDENLALHAAMYTWPARRIERGRVLDLGCEAGFGSLLISNANDGLKVVGIDLDLAALRYSRNMVGKRGVLCVQADANGLPVATESFSGIYLIHLLHLVEEPGRILSEARRALVPGGLAIVSGPGDEVRLAGQLKSAMHGEFAEVFYPDEIRGQLSHYPAQTFRMDRWASAWMAVCRKD